jgi:hypothetical protein
LKSPLSFDISTSSDDGSDIYDGAYKTERDGSMEGAVEFVLPPGVALITGAPAEAPTRVSVRLYLPAGFDDGRTVAIETPLGPVNARFEKLKDIP